MPLRLLLAAFAALALPASAQPLSIENFDRETVGAPPSRWVFYTSRGESQPLARHFNEREQFLVAEEGGRRFLRLYTRGEAQRITLLEGDRFTWNIAEHPKLRWSWRAHVLPEGAREDRRNDVGAALYITFGSDRLGRPKSIKYTYSSTLPVGTILRQGALRVVVVASGTTGRWVTVVRDVAADYRALFGDDAPTPRSLTLWSDSDDTRSEARVDVDDIALLP